VPWKAICPMDERVHFVSLVNESDETFTVLCERFGISRKTGYKWVARYEARGAVGLAERRPVAHSFPHRTPDDVLHRLIELRKEYPKWGPKKLRARLEALGLTVVPAASTIGEALKKHGLIRPRRRRVHPPMHPLPIEPTANPNDTWCVDFKGHFAVGDKSRCHPLTLTDHVTRYLLKCEGLSKADDVSVRPHFDRAFREFGLPTRIRSDNGPPFATLGVGGLSALSVWWIRLGIVPERIEPGHPEQNGRHERMHRTLKDDVASPPADSMVEQQRAFDRFRRIYNDERPHEALDMKTPASRYTPSRRAMPETPSSPEYPDTMKVRKLDHLGRLNFAGQTSKTTVSAHLAREPVGLEPIEEDCWRLHYGPVLLAEVTLKNKELRFERKR
jgi:transposase InsO family protein